MTGHQVLEIIELPERSQRLQDEISFLICWIYARIYTNRWPPLILLHFRDISFGNDVLVPKQQNEKFLKTH